MYLNRLDTIILDHESCAEPWQTKGVFSLRSASILSPDRTPSNILTRVASVLRDIQWLENDNSIFT